MSYVQRGLLSTGHLFHYYFANVKILICFFFLQFFGLAILKWPTTKEETLVTMTLKRTIIKKYQHGFFVNL